MQKSADAQAARDVELSRFRNGYEWKDFSTDSLRWSVPGTLWPGYEEPEAAADSVLVPVAGPQPRPLPEELLQIRPGDKFPARKRVLTDN